MLFQTFGRQVDPALTVVQYNGIRRDHIGSQLMVCVTEQDNRNAMIFSNPLCYAGYRTSISVNINSQAITSQYLLRYPFQIIAGNQPVHDSMVSALNTVMESVLSMTVGVDHLLRLVFFRNGCEITVSFHHICRRIMQEHDKTAKSVLPGSLKGDSLVAPFPGRSGELRLIPPKHPNQRSSFPRT